MKTKKAAPVPTQEDRDRAYQAMLDGLSVATLITMVKMAEARAAVARHELGKRGVVL